MIRIPIATYRLQLHAGFGFEAAREVVPYLQRLGISDVYASPYLAAEKGSTHGYNLVDHGRLNPEIGTDEQFVAWTDTLRAAGMGHILDLVPNHMGISTGENPWWNDVLENGPSSAYGDYFDIDWAPPKESLRARVLLPILGDQFGEVLERGELQLRRDSGAFFLYYYEHRLPIAPRSLIGLFEQVLERLPEAVPSDDKDELASVLTSLRHLPVRTDSDPEQRIERAREKEVIKRRTAQLCANSELVRVTFDQVLSEYNGRAGEPETFERLEELLQHQCYRLSSWRVAAEQINYRRFFDINGLAAIRMEEPSVFAATHALVFKLVGEGRLTGLRLDHTDGLYDPRAYFDELQRGVAAAQGSSADEGNPKPFYVLAEKILEHGEVLPRSWPIHGTVGYDFLASVSGLWVDPRAEAPFSAFYRRFTGNFVDYQEQLYRSKRQIMRSTLASEITMLGRELERIADGNRRSRDFTLQILTRAIVETIAAFPVYRTYVRPDGAREETDDQYIEHAIRHGQRLNPEISQTVFAFLRDILLLRLPARDDAERARHVHFAMRFQQLTGPVMAKAAEDTAFYNYLRLVSLNEVGGDPSHFGTSIEQFHAQNARRATDWPHTMLATSTHDTKRGEDTRARIAALTEVSGEFRHAVGRWSYLAKQHKVHVGDEPAPSRSDEYLFYQTLVGAWPILERPEEHRAFIERIADYMGKAAKEAKVRTSWVNPNNAYDAALRRFVESMLSDERFVDDLRATCLRIETAGATNSLGQVLMKLAMPGVPDIYQGTELWAQTLVDPDNRQPVDYAARMRLLAELEARDGDRAALVDELRERWRDGAIKMHIIRSALAARQASPSLYRDGIYHPIPVSDHVVAFGRAHDVDWAVCAVARLTLSQTGGARPWAIADVWGDAVMPFPKPGRYRNILTGRILMADETVRLATVFEQLPVALFELEDS